MNNARLLRYFATILAVSSWFVLVAGCPGTLTEEEKKMFQGGTSCPDVPTLLSAKCGTAGCHIAGANAAGALDLLSTGVESRVVGAPGTAYCKGIILANPADATNSLLYAKLVDQPPCGLKMPLGVALPPSEVACIKTWIEGLDPNAGTGGMGGSGGVGGTDGGM